MNTPSNRIPPHDTYTARLIRETNDGWQVVSEGPSGAQLKKGRKVRPFTALFIIAAVPTLAFYPIFSVFLLCWALLNHAMTQEQTKFLSRDA